MRYILGKALLLLAFIFHFALEAKAQDSCEHARFAASLKGLSNLVSHFLVESKVNIDEMLASSELGEMSVELRSVLGNYIYLMPFSNDSVLRIYNQRVEAIQTSPLKIQSKQEDLILGASVSIFRFSYLACMDIVEPDGSIYYTNCNIRFQLHDKSGEKNTVSLLIQWLEHTEDYLPMQIAKSSVKIQITPESISVDAIGENKKPSWFDHLIDYFLDSESVIEGIVSRLTMAEDYLASYFDAEIRSIPSHARNYIKVPQIDLKSLSLQAYLPAKNKDLIEYLRDYRAWVDKQKRSLLEKRYAGLSFQRRESEFKSFFQDHLSMRKVYDFSSFAKLNEEILKLKESILTKKQNLFSEKEIASINKVLVAPVKDYLAFYEKNLLESESRVNIVNYYLNAEEGLVSFGLQLDDYPCVVLSKENLREKKENILKLNNNFDFSLFVWTDAINKMIEKSFRENKLDLKVDSKTTCRKDLDREDPRACRYAEKVVVFKKQAYLKSENSHLKLVVPKLDVPGPLSAKFSTNIKLRPCLSNPNLCIDFNDLEANGRLIPILRFLNLFLLDIIDVDGRIERELNDQLASLGQEGLQLMPKMEVVSTEDSGSDFIEIKYRVEEEQKTLSPFLKSTYQ